MYDYMFRLSEKRGTTRSYWSEEISAESYEIAIKWIYSTFPEARVEQSYIWRRGSWYEF